MDEHQFGFDMDEPAPRGTAGFDPAEIREDALAMLASARAVGADGQWDAAAPRYHRAAFPHLVSWLPDPDERAQLCFEFNRELERIERLLAA